MWNSLPNFVVDLDSIDLFKAQVGKFWMHQQVNVTSQLTDNLYNVQAIRFGTI